MSKRPVYIVANANGMRTHIARYQPRGYGVATLCGKSWNEGDFRVVSRGDTRPRPCMICDLRASRKYAFPERAA